MILRNFTRLNLLDEFKAIVKGFADTLIIFKSVLPDRKKEKKKFSQGALTQDLLGAENLNGAHNAVVDVAVLQKLIVKINVDSNTIKQNTKSVSYFMQSEKIKMVHSLNKLSLESFKGKITSSMRTKIAKAGINKALLLGTFKTSGSSGIKLLLGEDVGGRPRVTKQSKSVNSIIKLLSLTPD